MDSLYHLQAPGVSPQNVGKGYSSCLYGLGHYKAVSLKTQQTPSSKSCLCFVL